MSDEELPAFLKELGARFSPSAVRAWKKISEVLVQKYGGDPRNITPQPLTVSEIKRRLSGFPNLRGSKLSNFYIRAMGETGLFKVEDLNELDVPVDKQVARFTIYTGVLRLTYGSFRGAVCSDPLRSLIQGVWRKAAKALGIAPWMLDEPMWNIGSKLCARRKCVQCPVEDLCDKTKDVRFEGGVVFWRA